MIARLASDVLVSALMRRVNNAGGAAAVLARGDAQGGMILVIAMERGANPRLLERGIGADGQPALVPAGGALHDDRAVTNYWQRRRSRDPDLWVVELDIALAERFAAETILGD